MAESRPSSSATTVRVSTWPMRKSCSFPSSDCTTPGNSRGTGSAWRRCSGSSSAMVAGSGPKGNRGKGRPFILRCREHGFLEQSPPTVDPQDNEDDLLLRVQELLKPPPHPSPAGGGHTVLPPAGGGRRGAVRLRNNK